MNYLDFEQPIVELQGKIDELRFAVAGSEIDIGEEIGRLEARIREVSEQIFSNLSPWQVVQIARHPQRPYTLDYIKGLFTEWEELHGDRHFGDDPAIVTGLARLNGRPCAVIGHQKGRDTKERIYRNFGMTQPEGYRKALRIMKLAEKFNLPVLSFIDTAGAYAGISAEERNQSEAIARCLFEMSKLRVPSMATVIGEGGSGGALAIGVSDHIMMLQFSTYSVISPESCSSILFKKADRAREAAAAMKITAKDLLEFGFIDEIIPEPLGGAHRNHDEMIKIAGLRLTDNLERLIRTPITELMARRYQRLMGHGVFEQAKDAVLAARA